MAHAAEPSFAAYWPAAHSVQAEVDTAECFPTAHAMQMLAPSLAPVFVIDPAAHSAQSLAEAEPVVSTYLPATQPMHDVARVDAIEYCPTAQAVQVVAPVPAPLSVIEPAAQVVQDGTSDTVEYSPAAHSSHELAPAAVPLSVREPAKQALQ